MNQLSCQHMNGWAVMSIHEWMSCHVGTWKDLLSGQHINGSAVGSAHDQFSRRQIKAWAYWLTCQDSRRMDQLSHQHLNKSSVKGTVAWACLNSGIYMHWGPTMDPRYFSGNSFYFLCVIPEIFVKLASLYAHCLRKVLRNVNTLSAHCLWNM